MIAPLPPPPCCLGRPVTANLREVLNRILFVLHAEQFDMCTGKGLGAPIEVDLTTSATKN